MKHLTTVGAQGLLTNDGDQPIGEAWFIPGATAHCGSVSRGRGALIRAEAAVRLAATSKAQRALFLLRKGLS
jgi:hypothetical protein